MVCGSADPLPPSALHTPLLASLAPLAGVQGAAESNEDYIERVKKHMNGNKDGNGNGHYGTNTQKGFSMPPISWDQLEAETTAASTRAAQKNAKGRGRRKGNGTLSTFASNGEFDGSAQPGAGSMDPLAPLGGGASGPRALFVAKDGTNLLTWNEIERINMDDLNSALGPFNAGKFGGRRPAKKFYGLRMGNGQGYKDAKNTRGMIGAASSSAKGQDSSTTSPLQARRRLKASGRGAPAGANVAPPKQPAGGRRVKFQGGS